MTGRRACRLLTVFLILSGLPVRVAADEPAAGSARSRAREALVRLAGEKGVTGLSVTWPEARPVPRRVSGMDWTASGSARDVATRFAEEFADLLGVEPVDLEWDRNEVSRGRTAVHFRQTWKGIPVSGAKVVIQVSESGRVLSSSSGARPVVVPPPEADVGEEAARNAAVKSLGSAAELGKALPLITGRLVLPSPDRTQIVYRVLLPTVPGMAKLVVLVDAATGEIVQTFNDVRR